LKTWRKSIAEIILEDYIMHQQRTEAALYARVSSDRQDADLSVAAQMRALRD